MKKISEAAFRKSILYPLLCALCRMMYDAYAMQNDVMMLCYEKKVFVPKLHTHIPAIKYIIFFVSALTFRCKLCIPLGTSLELLRLLLSAESALTFRCKLCIPLGTSLEQKTYTALLLERLFVTSANLLCVPWNDFLLLRRIHTVPFKINS